jgi:hypothetical protein
VTPAIAQEALILAELFGIDEQHACELVIAGLLSHCFEFISFATGDNERTNFPSLARGLCAVLAYYSYHSYIAQILLGMLPVIYIRYFISLVFSIINTTRCTVYTTNIE